ncbi:MAG: acyl-CoA/acyl-ACP dehydrogenase [Pirellulales bacterium]|nr:acyl-CoA/acyl-ACP dehydrogenase [Pirellulales bacterium]
MAQHHLIIAPEDPGFDDLCRRLAERANELDFSGQWPGEQLRELGKAGVYRWFVPTEWGGFGWSESQLVQGYIRLGAACLTTAFILTQRSGAVRRIVECSNETAKRELLPALVEGSAFATVGISHLTTSRRHLAKPVLQVWQSEDGFVLDGYSPWVTGGAHANTVVIGATLDDGRQVLLALPTSLPGVHALPHSQLVGLTASHTGRFDCNKVHVGRQWLLDGPSQNVMAGRGGTKTGGLQTSALAVGLATAAIEFLEHESEQRADLAEPTANLRSELESVQRQLVDLAAGNAACSSDDLRRRANSLVLRATQAALAAAKGSGYLANHPAGRWCREALFFLVWSCPQPVMAANLCELAGLLG